MSLSFLKLKHPYTCIVAGTTGSGKTRWTRYLLKYWKDQIKIKKPKLTVLWCYGQWQYLYRIPIRNKNVNVIYHDGVPSIEQIKKTKPDIIVIDDLMDQIKKNESIKTLFIKGSHHLGISVMFIVQNIFHQDKNMRTISLNSHYINVMKGVRLTQQICILGNQIFPGKGRKIVSVFNRATQREFTYLLFDLHPRSVDKFRLRTRLFRHELPRHLRRKYKSVPIFYEI